MNVPKPHQHHQACAACKYQRRKCQPDCTLAPYFPPTNQQQFLNAHRLFGVSNIVRTLRNLDTPFQRDEAMKTMIFEAEARALDPVGGCSRMVQNLENEIALCTAELNLVHNQVAMYRTAVQQHVQQQMQMNETKMGLIDVNQGDGVGLIEWVGQDVVVDPTTSIVNVNGSGDDVNGGGGGGEGSTSTLSHVEQNQSFLGMFDDPALESVEECKVKTEEGEETALKFVKEEAKSFETAEGLESKEAASLSALTN